MEDEEYELFEESESEDDRPGWGEVECDQCGDYVDEHDAVMGSNFGDVLCSDCYFEMACFDPEHGWGE